MKTIKTFFITALAICCLNSYAGKNEQWIDIGFRISPTSSWLLNGNMMKDKNIKYVPSFGFFGGAKIGFNFSEVVAINVEGIFEKFNQRFTSRMDSISWDKKTQLTYIDIPVILRFTNGWKYYEIGVNLQSLKKAKGTFSSEQTIPDINSYSGFTTPTPDQFNKTNTSIILGWGSALWGVGGLVISTGIRLSYGLTDNTGENYIDRDYPNPEYPGYVPDLSNPTGKSYKKTNNVSAAFMFSFDYDLGYFMSSSCRRKHAFVLFTH